WYRIDTHSYQLVRMVDRIFLGSDYTALIEAEGVAPIPGFGACMLADGSDTCRNYVINQESSRYWGTINQFYAGLLLRHANVRVENGEVHFDFDVEAINNEVNSNGNIRWMLGFINHFRSQDLDAINPQSNGTFTVTENSAREYFNILREIDVSLPIQNDSGSIEYVSFNSIVNEQSTTILERSAVFERVQRFIRIENQIRTGTYMLGSAQHQQDVTDDFIDSDGNMLPQNTRVTEEINRFRTTIRVQFAESMLTNFGNNEQAIGDYYTGLTIINSLISNDSLDQEDWLQSLPNYQRQLAERGLRFTDRVTELRAELDQMRTQIETIESTSNGEVQPGTVETLFSLCRSIRELETYYQVVGYSNEAIMGLASFRNGIETLIGVNNISQEDLYREPQNSIEDEARTTLATDYFNSNPLLIFPQEISPFSLNGSIGPIPSPLGDLNSLILLGTTPRPVFFDSRLPSGDSLSIGQPHPYTPDNPNYNSYVAINNQLFNTH
ncbi:MAG: hypothetical protein ABID35_06150, partial [Candidatus Margulisiibacteriota bacterium]